MNDQPQTRPFEGFTASSGYEGGLEDGQYYNATLKSLTEVEITSGQWPGWKVEWTFGIDGSSEDVSGLTSKATGDQSTAGTWIVGLVGKARYDEMKTRKLEPAEIIGRPCMILVTFSERGWPRVGGVFPRQTQPVQVAPSPAPAPTQAAPAAATPPVAATPPPAAPGASAHQGVNFDDLPF